MEFDAETDAMTLANCAKGTGVATTRLNVRAGRSTSAEILGQLAAGQPFTYWALIDDWAAIHSEDGALSGWVHTGYTLLSAPVS